MAPMSLYTLQVHPWRLGYSKNLPGELTQTDYLAGTSITTGPPGP
jgi:hypothetical protein